MNVMAGGRWALIIAAGVWLSLAGPIRAQQSDMSAPDATANSTSDANTESATDAPAVPAKPIKPRPRKPAAAQLQPAAKMAAKPSNGRKTDDAQGLRDEATSRISTSISNAKAQIGGDSGLKLMSVQPRPDAAATSTDATAPNAEAAQADQPADANTTQGTQTQASPYRDNAPVRPVVMAAPYAASNVDSTWGRTSLIGKVFVAVGGLLTLASAARMFIA